MKANKGAVEAALRTDARKPDYSGLLALERSDGVSNEYDPQLLVTDARHAESATVIPVLIEPQVIRPAIASGGP